jgi:DNA-binding HxlR family transcriptional regulator
MYLAIFLMVVAGVLGGSAYCFANYHPANLGPKKVRSQTGSTWDMKDWLWRLLAAIVVGIVAAFTVPLFLHAMSSDLMREITEPCDPPKDDATQLPKDKATQAPKGQATDHQPDKALAPFVFFAFCLLAAYAAQPFLKAMLGHILTELEHRVDRAEATAQSAEDAAQEIAEDFSEPENGKEAATEMGQPPDLSSDDKRVLEAFQKARREKLWLRRSKEGLAADTGLTEQAVVESLGRLVAHGLVQKRPGRGRVGWLLTPTGLSFSGNLDATVTRADGSVEHLHLG